MDIVLWSYSTETCSWYIYRLKEDYGSTVVKNMTVQQPQNGTQVNVTVAAEEVLSIDTYCPYWCIQYAGVENVMDKLKQKCGNYTRPRTVATSQRKNSVPTKNYTFEYYESTQGNRSVGKLQGLFVRSWNISYVNSLNVVRE